MAKRKAVSGEEEMANVVEELPVEEPQEAKEPAVENPADDRPGEEELKGEETKEPEPPVFDVVVARTLVLAGVPLQHGELLGRVQLQPGVSLNYFVDALHTNSAKIVEQKE